MASPLFDWLHERGSGVLLHPTSLPGPGGIGVLGSAAERFIDLLKRCGFSYWQVCPLGPTGFGDSPYQCFSAFAGNPYLIDCESLVPLGLLQAGDLQSLRSLPADQVDFGALYFRKWPVLRQAFRRFREMDRAYLPNYGLYEEFKEAHASWLEPYALFMALKEHHQGAAWNQWDPVLRSWESARSQLIVSELEERCEAHRFYQYLFYGQWSLVRRHAAGQGISLIGDVPIFVACDSADVWSRPELFQLDDAGNPLRVAGVPPDYFSPDGQLWGNPLYDWKALAGEDYRWWIDRLKANLALTEIVRLDHFRGFAKYWSVPAEDENARGGQWVRGPGLRFFKALRKALPEAQLIAEDLGEITPDVDKLLDRSEFPGMAVLQFAFDGDPGNGYLPHNLIPNSVIYPGTHDNDTTLGWYAELPEAERHQLRSYFRVGGEAVGWDFIRAALASVSRLAIIPLQDLLSLGSEARMNRPGSASGNWQWRTTTEELDRLESESADYLREVNRLYGRTAKVSGDS